jgi:hypothetical protein
MTLMRLFLFLLIICGGLVQAEVAPVPQSRIAKIELGELEDDLRDVIFAKPEYAALKAQVETMEKAEAERNRLIQEAHAAGKDINEALKAAPEVDERVRQKLTRVTQGELLRFLVKRYGNRFLAIIDSNQMSTDSIIFLDGEVVDLTQTVKQALQLNDF